MLSGDSSCFLLLFSLSIRPNFLGPSDTSVCRSLTQSQSLIFELGCFILIRWVASGTAKVVHPWENTIYVIRYCAIRYSHRRFRFFSALGRFVLIFLGRPIRSTYVNRFR